MGGAMVDEYVTRRPAPELRRAVGAYSGYRQHGLAPTLHRGLPSPYLTFIFTLDEPLHIVQHTDAAQTPGYYDSLVGGLHTTPALIHHDGAQSGVQVSLSPLWARRLFGLPAGEIANLDVTADDLLGSAATARIQARLREAGTWSARFDVLDRELVALVDDPSGAEVSDEVRFTWDGLRDDPDRRADPRERLERPASDHPLPARDGFDAEGGRPGDPLRPRAPAAAT